MVWKKESAAMARVSAERGQIFISAMTSTAVPGRGAGGASARAGGGQKYLVRSEGAE